MDDADRIADLQCELANARADASDCCDGYEGQIGMLQEALKNTQRQLAEARKAILDDQSVILREQARADAAERQLAEMRAALEAARKPEDYWRQVAEATELSKRGLEQDNTIFREERNALLQDIEKQNKDLDEHQARWQRAERQLAEMRRALNRIARGAELQARVMRDPRRTGGWAGAKMAANAFDDIADRARAVVQDLSDGQA